MRTDIQQKLLELFRFPSPVPLRGVQIRPQRIKVNSPRDVLVGIGSDGASIRAAVEDPPDGSYQWLYFDTLSGSVPAGAQTFTIRGPAIPFIGGITEIDVVATDPGTDWQMRISADGHGSLFRTSEPLDQLRGEGFFRPTPPGFWPETEGIVFQLPTPGIVPMLEFSRLTAAALNLTVRVFIVAHPVG